VVTHDAAVAARMHRRIEMLDGRIVTDDASPPSTAPGEGAPPAGRPAGEETR
jgi:hypothetical protein